MEPATATLEQELKDLSAMTHAITQHLATQSQVNDAIVSRLLALEDHVRTLESPPSQLEEMRRRIEALWQTSLPSAPAPAPKRRSSLLTSRLCTGEQFQTEWQRRWVKRLGLTPRLHRKVWELCYVAQALDERGLLEPGRKGLGFAVGAEPLPAVFASLGCSILATDQDRATAEAEGWASTNQHAASLENLNRNGLCDPEDFKRRVAFRTVDMNAIPSDLVDYDFTWSCCSFEHLGSIEQGQRFVLRSLDCLKPGGVAVHTTEFNVSSNTHTVDHGGTVLFRRRDIEDLAAQAAAQGHEIELDFSPGQGLADHYVDAPPYKSDIHLKLELAGYVTTSIGLIIRKAED